MIDKRDGVTKRPVQTVDNGFPKSKPTPPGGGKSSSGGRPESQKPAPRPKVVNR